MDGFDVGNKGQMDREGKGLMQKTAEARMGTGAGQQLARGSG
jgi:hypothetical protein